MKKTAATILATLSAAPGIAGSLVYSTSNHAPQMADAAPMGDTVGWLIPLIALVVVMLAVSTGPSRLNGVGNLPQ